MRATPHNFIDDLELEPGRLSFEARVGGRTQRVWLRTDTPVTPNADAALAACLMPAMRSGGTLTVDAPISARILRTQREFQAIQRVWSLDWEFGDPPLREVEVIAPARAPQAPQGAGRVAAFFSGGVDSWSTVLDDPAITDLIFVRGIDLLPWAAHQVEVADEVEARLREAAGELGLPLHTVETNLRELSDPLARWEAYYGCAIVTVALFLAPLFERVLIAGDSDHEVQVPLGANRMVDQLWSTEDLEIVDDGGRFSRIERLRRIAGHPVVQRTLRVCWENQDGAYNCGRCRKCLMTMFALEAVGARERIATFPPELDMAAVVEIVITQPVTLTLWQDVLDAARAEGRTDLEPVLEGVLAAGKRTIGLPANYRRRRAPAAGEAPRSLPSLFATPATAAAIERAPAVAVLVGSYDGSGNYGDIAQLDAALDLLDRLGPGLLVLPVLERSYLAGHRALAEAAFHPPAHALFFDSGDGGDDDLVSVAPPAELTFAASYLYGGGYLNPSWGARKLAMLRAAEALVGATSVCRVASGLQVDAGWIAGLGEYDRAPLRAFEVLGVRDRRSGDALSSLAPILETADDAVGVLRRWPSEAAPGPGDALHVNVQFVEHDWVTARSEALLSFYVDFLDELAGCAGVPLVAHPLIAYLDDRITEDAAVTRLTEVCAARGIEVAASRVIRPAGLAEAVPELRRASLTVSCSYHVALTSLLLGVPTVAVRDNPYYEQKAAGLAEAFDLPAAFTVAATADPRAAAREVGGVVLDDARRAELQRTLAAGARKLHRRRAAAEADLLARLGGAAMTALASRSNGVGAPVAPTPPTSAAPPADERARAAEARLAATERELSVVLASRSWTMTGPMRRAADRLRRRTGR